MQKGSTSNRKYKPRGAVRTEKQLQLLVSGAPSKSLSSEMKIDAWKSLTEHLNRMGPPEHEWMEWRTVYSTYKTKLKLQQTQSIVGDEIESTATDHQMSPPETNNETIVIDHQVSSSETSNETIVTDNQVSPSETSNGTIITDPQMSPFETSNETIVEMILVPVATRHQMVCPAESLNESPESHQIIYTLVNDESSEGAVGPIVQNSTTELNDLLHEFQNRSAGLIECLQGFAETVQKITLVIEEMFRKC